MTDKFSIAPSILSADFAQLKDEIADVESGSADLIHIDVMDGHFVPNITMGPLVVSAIRPHTELPLDVHLMTSESAQYIREFAQAGADMISVHAEACTHLHRTVHHIKEYGKKAGVALNPATSIDVLEYVLPDIDFVLLMTVNPGFGGQSFIEPVLAKITTLRRMLDEKGFDHIDIEVDGGINVATIKHVADAGANIFVAGSAIFAQPNRHEAIQQLRRELDGLTN